MSGFSLNGTRNRICGGMARWLLCVEQTIIGGMRRGDHSGMGTHY
jgi:hypothetical protein